MTSTKRGLKIGEMVQVGEWFGEVIDLLPDAYKVLVGDDLMWISYDNSNAGGERKS